MAKGRMRKFFGGINSRLQYYSLSLSILLLVVGTFLYFLQEADYLTPHSNFGSGEAVDVVIGIIGLIMVFYMSPALIKKSYVLYSERESWIGYLLLVPILCIVGSIFQIGLGYLIYLSFLGSQALVLCILSMYIHRSRKNFQGLYFWILLSTMLIILVLVGIFFTDYFFYDKIAVRKFIQGVAS